jgi:pre-mRNA-splicing factor ATP-dependent RNA helicase DHX15/PRP43
VGIVRTTVQVHTCEREGDVLLLLTGQEEIENACSHIRAEADEINTSKHDPLTVYPLYSSITSSQQEMILRNSPKLCFLGGPPDSNIVISTNVAEALATFYSIVNVADLGFTE